MEVNIRVFSKMLYMNAKTFSCGFKDARSRRRTVKGNDFRFNKMNYSQHFARLCCVSMCFELHLRSN